MPTRDQMQTSTEASTSMPSTSDMVPGGGAQPGASITADRMALDAAPQSFVQVLEQQIGPLAQQLDLSQDMDALLTAAKGIVDELEQDASSLGDKLTEKLDTLIDNKAAQIFKLFPNGAELAEKLKEFDVDHPAAVWSAALLAAVAVYFTGPPKTNDKFKISDNLTASVGGAMGGFHQKLLSSLQASLQYHKNNFTATAGVTRDFKNDNTTMSLSLSEKDIEIIGQHADASFGASVTEGPKPSEHITAALKIANVTLKNTTTFQKGVGTTDSLSEEYRSKDLGNGWQVSGAAEQNFGPKHAADAVGVGVQLPSIDGVTVTLKDAQSIGGGTDGGNTQGVQVKVNEHLTVELDHGPLAQSKDRDNALSGLEESAGGGSNVGKQWHVGLKFSF